MPDIFGASFAPTNDENGNGRPRPGENGERGIQVLNLRLPRFQGARGIAPLSLLAPTPRVGGAAAPLGALLQTLLRELAVAPQQSPLTQAFGPTPSTIGAAPPAALGAEGPSKGILAALAGLGGARSARPPRIGFPADDRSGPGPQPAGPMSGEIRSRRVGDVVDRTSPTPREASPIRRFPLKRF